MPKSESKKEVISISKCITSSIIEEVNRCHSFLLTGDGLSKFEAAMIAQSNSLEPQQEKI